jgi:hypothetical protein
MGSRDSKKMKVKQIINLILQRLGNLIKIMKAVRNLSLLHYLTKKRVIKKKNLKYNRKNLTS